MKLLGRGFALLLAATLGLGLAGSLLSADTKVVPTTRVTIRAGDGAGTYIPSGAINVNTTLQATTGTVKQTLASFSLPANSLSATGKGVRIACSFDAAANANSKTATIDVGSQTFLSTTTTSGSGILLKVTAYKTGANTQLGLGHTQSVAAAGGGIIHTSGTQTDTAAILLACTATTPTAAGDVTFRSMLVEFFN